MNKLKSIFISTYLTYAAIIATIQIIQFTQSWDVAWLMSALVHLLPVGFIAKLFLTHTPRTDQNLNAVTIAMFGLMIAVMILMSSLPTAYPRLFTFALITLAGWILYLKWYSVLPARGDILAIGKSLPELALEHTDGSQVNTSTFLGKKTLYMFYRGNWCPLCMAQIKEIAQQYKQLDELGVQMVLVSSQPHSHSANLAKKHDVPFIFLADPKGKASKTIGVNHDGGTAFGMEVFGYSSNTLLPTVIITNELGQIIFLDQTDNYRVRPEPETFIKALGQ